MVVVAQEFNVRKDLDKVRTHKGRGYSQRVFEWATLKAAEHDAWPKSAKVARQAVIGAACTRER